jgi:threonine/homoserine/homoserine lactone efflux protein
MTLHAWLLFAAASWIIALVPGPGVTMIVGHALSGGRRAALLAVAGATLGNAAAMGLSLAGVGALLAASASAFTFLKYAGALYLMYLGVRALAAARNSDVGTVGESSARRTFGRAALATLLNPKTIVFFVALVPQFISRTAPALPQAIILLVTFSVVVGLSDAIYAIAASTASNAFKRQGFKRLGRAGGGALIGAGLVTALTGNK